MVLAPCYKDNQGEYGDSILVPKILILQIIGTK